MLKKPSGCLGEVLIIDNASTDATSDVARSFADSHPDHWLSIAVHQEPNPGLANARLRGIKESRYEILLFCDDDNLLSPEYLIGGIKVFVEHPNTGIVGGLGIPMFDIKERGWIRNFYTSLAIGPQSAQDGEVKWVYGAGMLIRKEIFSKLRARKITLMLTDRIGNVHSSGGDSEICILSIYLGLSIYYCSSLTFHHNVPAHRLKKKFFLRSYFREASEATLLFLLEMETTSDPMTTSKAYRSRIALAAKLILHYAPRSILGKFRFYSFVCFYSNVEHLAWLFLNWNKFKLMHQAIRGNLGQSAHVGTLNVS